MYRGSSSSAPRVLILGGFEVRVRARPVSAANGLMAGSGEGPAGCYRSDRLITARV